MTHPLESPQLLSDDSVRVLVDRLFNRWELDEMTRRHLLGLPAHEGAGTVITGAAIERGRRVLEMHAALRYLFPEDEALRWSWVHRGNGSLGGSTPLELMLSGDDKFQRVLRLLRHDAAT